MGLLRFILAISVLLFHSSSIFGFTLVGGQTAVQAFYIISGFYMALILNEKIIGTNNSYILFITNRFLRLYPIYWTVLLMTIMYFIFIAINSKGNDFAGFTIYIDYFDTMSFSSFLFLVFTNMFLFLQDAVMFLGLNTTTGHLFLTQNFKETNPMMHQFLFIPQAWTLGVEIAFYLIAPFIARKNIKIIVFLLFLSLMLRYILSQYDLTGDPWSYRFFPTELAFFLLGILSYHIYTMLSKVELKTLYFKVIWVIVLGFTLFYGFVSMPRLNYVFISVFFIGLPFIFILTKNWKYDSYIGELSYPIYISHIFVLICINSLKIPIIGGLGLTLTILTVLFSIVLNELVAEKIETIRQKRIRLNS